MPPSSFSCRFCDKNFHNSSNLKRHTKNLHNIDLVSDKKVAGKGNFRCPVCRVDIFFREDFVKHCSIAHDIDVKSETVHFSNEKEFDDWKAETERTTKTYFVKQISDKNNVKNQACKTRWFHCSRSGFYRPKVSGNNRKREIKIQGSRKIDGFCPCGIKVTYFKDGKVTAVYCPTHIGHKPDLAHVPLTHEERQQVATKLANKIPHEAILDSIRASVRKEDLDRIHLLTKQDLYNIEAEFGLNSETVRHTNDAVSVDAWIKEEQMAENSCILLYKPQYELSQQFSGFKEEDFALGIMTGAQEEILRKYGNDIVCIDGTHGLNGYDFEVVTLMVIDDMRQGFPCGFFICNRIDSQTIGIFLSTIKERVGELRPSVFMSDMAESFYNGWLSVMSAVEKRLFCTWHVDRAWQTQLRKIKGKEMQTLTYKKLRTLLEETDESAFLKMLPSIIKSLCDDESTKEFGEYFNTYYGKCYRQWAYCYRLNAGINTNMHLERMHGTIKHLYLKGKTVKRLDKSIHAIMQMVKQKLFDRLTILEKGKLTTKVRELRSRHKKSLEMNCDLIVENSTNNGGCWEIAASSGSQVYTVRLSDPNCHCSIVCKHCSACIHKYSCTCIDASIKWNMCKHIHLLCRKLKSLQETTTCPDVEIIQESDDEIRSLHIDEDNYDNAEKVAILEEIGSTEVKSFEEEKKELKESFEKTLDLLVTSKDGLKIGREALKVMTSRLLAIKTCESFPEVSPKLNPARKIEPQRRFLSLKKRNKSKVPKRPTPEESRQIALEAMLEMPSTSKPETEGS